MDTSNPRFISNKEGTTTMKTHDSQDKTTSPEVKPCLFSVNGDSRQMRRDRIEEIAKLEPSVGFLAAVFDFEWMARRAILALSACPTPVIRKYFEKTHGLNAYKDAWDLFVSRQCVFIKESLVDVVNRNNARGNELWAAISDAFGMRHPIVHGANGFIKDEHSDFNRLALLDASDALEAFLVKHGKTAFEKVKRARCQFTGMSGKGLLKDSRKKRGKRESQVQERVDRSKNRG